MGKNARSIRRQESENIFKQIKHPHLCILRHKGYSIVKKKKKKKNMTLTSVPFTRRKEAYNKRSASTSFDPKCTSHRRPWLLFPVGTRQRIPIIAAKIELVHDRQWGIVEKKKIRGWRNLIYDFIAFSE